MRETILYLAPPITTETVLASSSELVSCDVSGETVILSLKNAAYYGLDDVATRIWELLTHPQTVADVCAQLLSEYEGVDAERSEREVIALTEQLVQWGLVEVVSQTSPNGMASPAKSSDSRVARF